MKILSMGATYGYYSINYIQLQYVLGVIASREKKDEKRTGNLFFFYELIETWIVFELNFS